MATQVCVWRIKIPYYQKTKFIFTYFSFNQQTDCADSVVTISTSKMDYFFCSEKRPTIDAAMVFSQRQFVIKSVKTKWADGNGFEMRFSAQS